MTDITSTEPKSLAWLWLPADRCLHDGTVVQSGDVCETGSGEAIDISPLAALAGARGVVAARIEVIDGELSGACRFRVLWLVDAAAVLCDLARRPSQSLEEREEQLHTALMGLAP